MSLHGHKISARVSVRIRVRVRVRVRVTHTPPTLCAHDSCWVRARVRIRVVFRGEGGGLR